MNQIELEFPACPLCHSERRELSYGQFGEHKIMRCQDCHVHYLYPRLNESAMRRFYTNDNYFEGGDSGYSDTSYADQERALSATFKRLMRNLHKRKLTGGSLLEVGCGYGYLLEEAKEYFSRRVGTDFSPEGVRLASAKADEVYEGGIEQIPATAKFDCVIATHVIEHVYQPLEFVKQLISHTKPSGTVILAAPDMGGMLRKVMGHRWASFKIPEHVLYFDAATLSELMRQAGLIDIEKLPYLHAFPLALIASKLSLPFPAALGKANVWVPATTVALSGKVTYE
ncbi:MAG: class I SAM-dependent methyltransferase [Acidobacteriota bacterium]|jgi:2-polyprenyl-3-methyl-5-hydroxy-6-metoxy-1,4-benzoquinol methylase|nr:class I SAM-dependent methyltransferase [Acidobacteriota bacterium]MDQ3374529.1 class I SAM-dependent methyltransferase [Acidobacteriota bacterium]